MKFTEAFQRLGYSVELPRQDWSAEKDDGVCISLWRVEMGTDAATGLSYVDTRVHADPNEGWRDKSGNKKRIRHLQRAIDEFDGFVDVVIVHGKPREGYGDADPWFAKTRGGRWRVSDFEPETGHFTARIVPG